MRLGIWWDEHNRERKCVMILSRGRILFAIDAETQRLIPDPKAAIQVVPTD